MPIDVISSSFQVLDWIKRLRVFASITEDARYRVKISRARHVLYSRLVTLFLTRHVTSCRAVLAPYIGMRTKHAWRHLRKGHLHRALRTLGDRRVTPERAEIEFGGTFPLREIKQLLAGKEHIADNRLLNLVCYADRSRYEHPDLPPYELTDQEFALFRHIEHMHAHLARFLGLVAA